MSMLSNCKTSVPWLIALIISNLSCKSPSKRNTSESDLTGTEQDVIELRDFSYESDAALLKALSARVGCKLATDLAVLPASGSMKKTITELYSSKSPYDYLQQNLFDGSKRTSLCTKSAINPADVSTAAMRKLLGAARKKNLGITFVMAGGFGSHLIESGALFDSRQLWQKTFADEIKRGDLRILRHECVPNSFASDDICAPKIHAKFLELESKKTKEHRYLFWGYSKGGTSMLHALAQFSDIRERTLSLVTVGSPFGGGLPMNMIEPLVESLAKNRTEMSELNRALLGTMLTFGAGASLGNGKSVAQKVIPLYTGPEFETVRAGVRSLVPSVRKKFLYQTVKSWDLSRVNNDPLTGRRELPIFHLGSALDIAKLEAFPTMTTDNEGYMIPQSGSQDVTHLAELTSINNFARYPISDSCVALEHAVLPKNIVPKGAAASLLGILSLDHMALGFSSTPAAVGQGPRSDLPRTAIVDAILETAIGKMGIQ